MVYFLVLHPYPYFEFRMELRTSSTSPHSFWKMHHDLFQHNELIEKKNISNILVYKKWLNILIGDTIVRKFFSSAYYPPTIRTCLRNNTLIESIRYISTHISWTWSSAFITFHITKVNNIYVKPCITFFCFKPFSIKRK